MHAIPVRIKPSVFNRIGSACNYRTSGQRVSFPNGGLHSCHNRAVSEIEPVSEDSVIGFMSLWLPRHATPRLRAVSGLRTDHWQCLIVPRNYPARLTNWSNFLEKLTARSASQILRLLRNPKVHYRVHKTCQRAPILSQLNPSHIPPHYFPNINFNVILQSTTGSFV
jgi:hypothetical protein